MKKMKKIKNHNNKLNPVFTRYQFNNEQQGEDHMEQFVTRLKMKIKECKYQERNDSRYNRI